MRKLRHLPAAGLALTVACVSVLVLTCAGAPEPTLQRTQTPDSYAVHIAAILYGTASAGGRPLASGEVVARAGDSWRGNGVVNADGSYLVYVTGGTAPISAGCVPGAAVRFFIGDSVARQSFEFQELGERRAPLDLESE